MVEPRTQWECCKCRTTSFCKSPKEYQCSNRKCEHISCEQCYYLNMHGVHFVEKEASCIGCGKSSHRLAVCADSLEWLCGSCGLRQRLDVEAGTTNTGNGGKAGQTGETGHDPCTFCGRTTSSNWGRAPGGTGSMCQTCAEKLRRKKSMQTQHAPCTSCGRTTSSQWSKGPGGPASLCCRCLNKLRRKKSMQTQHTPCTSCGRTTSSQWSKGPGGPASLCCRCLNKLQREKSLLTVHDPCTSCSM
jgi:hypothetical protein